MAAGIIKLQANDGKIYSLTPEDGASANVEYTLPKEGGVLASESYAVSKTGDETIAGVKTFSSSPIVPTPTLSGDAVNKDYVDNLRTISTGTTTFDSTTNNINLTGIGVGVEIGDVIQISGATDSKNNSEFTIEVITDDNNIIVNQAHSNKGTGKNVVARVGDTGVTVKLLSKWYNASDGLGQGWVDMTSSRAFGVTYPNNTNRAIGIHLSWNPNGNFNMNFIINDYSLGFMNGEVSIIFTDGISIPRDGSYSTVVTGGILGIWSELR